MNTSANPSPDSRCYTAAEYAEDLGISPRAFRKRLDGLKPDGETKVRGQAAPTWQPDSLPADLRAEWDAAPEARGAGAALPQDGRAPWQPPKPWHLVPKQFQEQASKLADALAPLLARQHELPDLMERAAAAYQQHFGNKVSADRLRYVMDRATRRDGGLLQFSRPELYADESAFRDHAAPALDLSGLHAPLDEMIQQLQNPNEPTLDDREHLFHWPFKHLEELVALHPSKGAQRAIKNSLVRYLHKNVPGLYRPQTGSADVATPKPFLAIRRLFNLKYAEWIARDRTAQKDHRKGHSGKKGYVCANGCEKLIHDTAANLRGRKGKHGAPLLARRMLLDKNMLCEACVEHWKFDLRVNKSYMARTLRNRVAPNVLTIAKLKGRNELIEAGPSVQRDWSTVLPGDWFCADDETPNHRVWQEVEIDGGKKIIHGRFQNLVMADAASFFVPNFLMYIGAPSGRRIRELCAGTFLTRTGGVGIPRRGVIFEGGPWQSRLVAGDNSQNAVKFRETEIAFDSADLKIHFGPAGPERELGLREGTGIRIHHARSARAKPIERQFFDFQSRISFIREGFTGFREREEASKAMQDFTRRVENDQEHPGNEWLSLNEMAQNYRQMLDEYHCSPQNGRLRGRTPMEVWNEAIAKHPLKALPPEMEYVLATHKKLIERVGEKGISVTLSGYEKAVYWSAELAQQFYGKPVRVFWNLDFPQFITVCDPARQKFLCVERRILPAMTATPEQLAQLSSERNRFLKAATSIHGHTTQPLRSTIIRDNDFTEGDKRPGPIIEAHKAKVKAAEKTRKATSTRRAARAEALVREAMEELTRETEHLTEAT